MPIHINTNSINVPADVSSAMRDLTAACRAWPSPLSLHGGPNGGPVFLPPDVGQANEMCGHILNPQQLDHWLCVLSAFALVGFISMPMWLLRTYRLVRSWACLIMQFFRRGRPKSPGNIQTMSKHHEETPSIFGLYEISSILGVFSSVLLLLFLYFLFICLLGPHQ